mmetsp:Transcript_10891/g.18053  ORF Transcript_10891/g.18053 Transcript_10891/m.18053 type:complete len:504 (-) Transcript_10891:57-1568(-)|eukprot:CAMPEP_0119030572 /NCGR_PEP_ID=MMETSP1176-20130426/41093_1 /TAXON_ID=265551 /ORGANISM="Synedropsis recta cf, Strain CCMP1620" /LENGTH=503 /DNA_ID=CAMNT_0006986943 /DNA_START=500 /DNA_END=2011 /DNA_ORIENTATION=-
MSKPSAKKEEDKIQADQPTWRFAQIQTQPAASINPLARSSASNEVIDKAVFFAKAGEDKSGVAALLPPEEDGDEPRLWSPKTIRTVPAFYPLEKSSRFIEDDHLSVASRLSECLRVLSVQATYNDENATASLVTGENVEMHLSLWRTSGDASSKYPVGIVVELQRRKGDSIVFHRYSRYILDAAMGDFDDEVFHEKTGGDIAPVYTKKAERMLKMQRTAASEEESAIIAIEIAHGLLMKDRMDARQLGLESLCLLTDPQKTGSATALIASHVVLLGTAQGTTAAVGEGAIFDESPFQEIRETILSLIQLRRIGDEAGLSDDDEEKEIIDDDGFEGQISQEKEHMNLLHNLALAVLANALEVVEDLDAHDTEPEETFKPRSRIDSAEITNTFMNEGKDITRKELLSTLITELGKAANNPHNACLSAKCLRSLMGASDDARRRAKELGAKNVVSTALDVGVRTHAKLETECKKVVKVLTLTRTEEEEQQTEPPATEEQKEEPKQD